MFLSSQSATLKKILAQRLILYFVLFCLVFGYFFWLTNSQSFPDPDSFYHAKIVELIRDSGPVRDFPWLPFTTLGEVFIDHHFLYHLILVPPSFFWSPLLVVKFAAVFLAALAIIFFQWLLDCLKIKYSFVYTLILLFSDEFIFRLNLAKVPSLSLIFILVALYFIAQDKKHFSLPLFILSFAYVWLYGGWPILFGMALIYLIIGAISHWSEGVYQQKIKNQKSKIKILIQNFKLPLSIFSGLFAGLIINPYFPRNLQFYWQQTFEIGLVNYQKIVAVGAEWYGLSIFDLIGHNIYTAMLFLIALVLFFVFIRQQNKFHWLLLLLSLIFFTLTLKSQRNIEYFIPIALIFCGLVFSSLFSIKKYLLFIWRLYQPVAIILVVLLLLCLPIIFSYNFFSLRHSLGTGYDFDSFSGISFWFKENTPPKSIIFHDDWGSFPVLFYQNSANYYILGLDPTFMYFRDPDKYLLWKSIVEGEKRTGLCQLVKEQFNTNYIFVKKTNKALRPKLDLDHTCVKVYEDEDGRIYQIN